MSEATNEIPLDRKLTEIFDEGYSAMNRLDENKTIPSNAPEFQAAVKKAIGLFEDATRLVSLVGMFSTNESYEEVPTENLRYFLLPYFLGSMTLRLCNVNRSEVVEVAEVYFKDFLSRCENYRLYETPDRDSDAALAELALVPGVASSDKIRELQQMGAQRNEKIRKFQEKKELDEKIKQLRYVVEQSEAKIDDETKREFFLSLLKSAIIESQDELESIDREKQMLLFVASAKQRNEEGDELGEGAMSHATKKRPVKPLKPIIITRDAVQKAVYGIGYPSLPTMTVAEFYEQRVAEGIFPDPEKMKEVNKNSLMNKVHMDNAAEQDREDEEQEKLVERDDEEYLARQRAKDEFKDEHRRGEGNRYNRS
ncbi:immunoglobulin-binding protein 1 [Anopheles maculipalpis]|uniref:immunoglobulin-binding protein 1 n=1 Tax=Anopheles maculipalpis TaxID=1496333 RepID=UPI002159507B|nr:immunoglobulin-binding protein 1 [Anopheles maculipalpis]